MANSEDNKSYQTLLCSNFEILSVTTSISNSNLDFFQPNRQNDLILDSTQKFSNLRLEDWRKTQLLKGDYAWLQKLFQKKKAFPPFILPFLIFFFGLTEMISYSYNFKVLKFWSYSNNFKKMFQISNNFWQRSNWSFSNVKL